MKRRDERSSRVSRPAMVRFTYSDTPRGTLVLACNRVLWIRLDSRMVWLKLPVDTARQGKPVMSPVVICHHHQQLIGELHRCDLQWQVV